VAILPGTDEKLKDEWLVLMAHYDHIGTVDVPEGQDNICNGADDNASGTAAVVEVARLLAKGQPPKRSIVAVLTAGEETGAQGSVYFTAHPPAPMSKVVLAFNVDMVGRSEGSVSCRALGNDQLFEEAVEMGKKHGIQVQPDPYAPMMLLYFTDGLSLAKHSIPVVDLFTLFHADYHMPTDEIDKIKFNELEKITKIIHRLANHYAQGAPRPEYQRPSWFILPD
jgi:putative aminopeptidase FrvX